MITKLTRPGNPEYFRLLATAIRKINTSSLVVITRRDGKKFCIWCCKKLSKSFRHRYCSDKCKHSAAVYCYPQSDDARIFFLERQGRRCAACQHKFALPFHREPLETYPEVDHIVPIWKGGQGIGIENHQVLCKPCHLDKTKLEATERAAIKREENK